MKTLILTHKADIDGLSPVIFLKMIRDDVDTLLLNAGEANTKLTEIIKNKSYEKYDEIYVTDLTLNKATCDLIMSTKNQDKFHTFDHHSSDLSANNYSFGTSISHREDGIQECATSLFQEYLSKRYPEMFDRDIIREYTELVRQNDTWDWAKTNNLDALNLGELLDIVGRDYYIKYFTEQLKKYEHFSFSENQQYLFKIEEQRRKRYFEETEKTMFHGTLCGKKCGIVFAEKYRSLLGNYLVEKYSYCIDYVVIINMQQGVSFRSKRDDINVSEIASVFGGGGHVKASGCPLDNALKKEIIKYIFNDDNIFN